MKKAAGAMLVIIGMLALVMRRFVRAPMRAQVRLASINRTLARVGLILVVRAQERGERLTVFSVENRRHYLRRSRLERRIVASEGRELDQQMERYSRALAYQEGQRTR